jgi:copper chaperone CopZ
MTIFMRIIIFIILTVIVVSCVSKDPKITESFKVWGNCEKCEKTIESSVDVDGVISKDWNVDSKLMTVTFDTTKISLDAIQQLIAKTGYDNDTYYGDDYAYAKLEECCQYERRPFE